MKNNVELGDRTNVRFFVNTLIGNEYFITDRIVNNNVTRNTICKFCVASTTERKESKTLKTNTN